MASEQFRLQPLLEHKQQQEERQMLELASLAAEERQAREVLETLREQEEVQLGQLSEIAQAGAIDPARLDAALTYLDSIEGSITQQLDLVATVEAKVLAGRDQLVGILKERRSLERLKQQRAEQMQREAGRREAGRVDDMTTQRHIRRAQGEA